MATSSPADLGKTPSRFALEILLLFSLALVYFYGVVILARTTVLFEILFCLAVPAVILFLKRFSSEKTDKRVLQLIAIEVTFMAFAIISKVSQLAGVPSINHLISYGFLTLFVLQFTFFAIYQRKVNSYFGMIRTIMFLILVFPWFYHTDRLGLTDGQGRFLLWGAEAPPHIILYYCVWVIGVPLVDSRTLPNFVNATLHFASVAVALWSQEFFHARLLTAAHLFVMDSLFGFSKLGRHTFCTLTETQFQLYNAYVRKALDWVTLLACAAIAFRLIGR